MKQQKLAEEVDKINPQEHLAELIDTYQNLIFSICCKITNDYFIAEDLTQETFLSAYQNREQFTGGNEKAWLCRIATNKSLDYMKQAARRSIPTEDEVFETEKSDVGLPEATYMEKEVSEELLERCRKLKPPYDEIAVLYFHDEKKPEEIAQILSKNVKTIQTQIYRARAMLREMYGKKDTNGKFRRKECG